MVKFNTTGVRQWGTYYGGKGYEDNSSVTTNSLGDVFLSGSISDNGFNQSDAFLVKFNDEIGLPPTISGFTPISGYVDTTVTINGTNFTGVTFFSFNNINAISFTVNSTTSITTKVPVGATTGKVRVTTGSGTATSLADFIILRTWYRDRDKDGFGSDVHTIVSESKPAGSYVLKGGDCRDGVNTVYPGAPELGDGIDNDCDGEVDEGLACRITWYKDADGDGYGRLSNIKLSCLQPNNYVDTAGDCNDNDPNRNPDAEEACDGYDNNCNGVKDEDCLLITSAEADAPASTMLAAQKVAPEKISANAFPNPHNGSFVLEVQSPVAGKSAIVLYDLQGRAMVQRQEQLQVGTNMIRFDAVQKTTFMYKVTIGAHSAAGKVLSVQ